ncbi:MAG: redox-sensing transcriptional repressor Rex [Gemmataceae bacterium]
MATQEPRLSRATVGRLSLYLRRLEEVVRDGRVPGLQRGRWGALGITDTQVRKDLAFLGRLGQPGIGYDVADLVGAIRSTLGIDRGWSAALVGVGNLARALLRYDGFVERGFRIVAAVRLGPGEGRTGPGRADGAPDRPHEGSGRCDGRRAWDLDSPRPCRAKCNRRADRSRRAGLVELAPGVIRVKPGVSVVNVDLTVQLEQLAFLVHLASTGPLG